MKAAYINNYGGLDEIVYGELPDPVPGKGEVLIGVKAVSVNPVDWKVREGRLKFLSGKNFPLILGSELAGVVVELGKDVTDFKVGDRVFAGLSHKGGAYAEFVKVSAKKVIKIPDSLSFESASTLAIAGMTPMQAFTLHSRLGPGDKVLVNGASGGVGTYAVQIAKILGAEVVAVCSSRNAELVTSLGADEVIDYTVADFRQNKEAYDLVLDAAANAFFPDSRSCLKKGGLLIKLNLSWKSLLMSIWSRLFSRKKLKMILVKNRPEDMRWMIDQLSSGKMKVIIDRKYPLAEAAKAQEYSMSGRARGKIVLVVGQD